MWSLNKHKSRWLEQVEQRNCLGEVIKRDTGRYPLHTLRETSNSGVQVRLVVHDDQDIISRVELLLLLEGVLLLVVLDDFLGDAPGLSLEEGHQDFEGSH